MENKKLYKKQEGKILEGVCAGIADYFNIDPTLVRLIWVLFGCTGTGIIAYIICAIIFPKESDTI